MSSIFVLLRGVAFGAFLLIPLKALWITKWRYWDLETPALWYLLGVVGVIAVALHLIPRQRWGHRMLLGPVLYLIAAPLTFLVVRNALGQILPIWGAVRELLGGTFSLPNGIFPTVEALALLLADCCALWGLMRVLLHAEIVLWTLEDYGAVQVPSVTAPFRELLAESRARCDWGSIVVAVLADVGQTYFDDDSRSFTWTDDADSPFSQSLSNYDDDNSSTPSSSSDWGFNPASGLPMLNDTGIDVAGNPFGVDLSDSFGWDH